ncbi:acetolactate synthase 2 small subunit [Thalassotalea ganghwensis]
MKDYQLVIEADDKQVVLERILQVTRYRGFMISGINAQVNTGTHIGTIKLAVRSERAIELLVDQINKLVDIKQVKVDNKAVKQYIA